MKASRFFIGTLKEAPADAEIVSHKLMMRAGMIRRVAGGIYDYLPIGLRSIRKVEAIRAGILATNAKTLITDEAAAKAFGVANPFWRVDQDFVMAARP